MFHFVPIFLILKVEAKVHFNPDTKVNLKQHMNLEIIWSNINFQIVAASTRFQKPSTNFIFNFVPLKFETSSSFTNSSFH